MVNVIRTSVLALVVVSAGVVPAGQPSGTIPDFAKLRDEAVQIEQTLIRIDSSNPPGNESKVAEHVRAILEREGIASEIFTLEPGRGSLVARLKGSGLKRPVLLMGHTDVVGVERDKWTVDPFAAVIKDGYLYGRGAVDDKDNVAAALIVMLTLHRLKVPLDRNVIFMAEAGEEATSQVGVGFMVDKHWEQIDCEFALAEGGTVPMRNGVVRYMGVATTEKLPRRLRLVAR
ncbi:MAG: M20/M25/M40 family metallo-hydrolase, partial [Acidobacteria bacterium]|nr:M20/M25/M40 family metallo-hydrolase [Acidobacteriota bacterium]